MRNKKLIALGIIAFLTLCVAYGDKARMMCLLESAIHMVKGFFGA